MRKKISKIIMGILMSSLLLNTQVFAETPAENTQVLTDAAEAVSPRMTVGKYVEISRNYVSAAEVPKYYYYSYFDHDYNVTLHGHLEIKTVIDCDTYVVAVFYGYVCGTM
ncbi:MAG: hypothetical protein PHG16_06570 [Lachnospiraceae bacterium]|nr:hypothetical protein [Lachnospiraceae bacterium]